MMGYLLLEAGSIRLKKSGFFSIMKSWQEVGTDRMSAIYLCRKMKVKRWLMCARKSKRLDFPAHTNSFHIQTFH